VHETGSCVPCGAGDSWWRSAAIYQLYVRSFADGNGDGTGDLAGVRGRLAYLADLGVDAIWFNPWYPSPMSDAGYDISDYRRIEPVFGTLADAAGVPRGSAEFQTMLGDQLLDRLTNTRVRALITRPGDLEAAAAHFDSALARRPDLATALRGLAHVRLFQGRREEAVATLEKAVRIEPGDAATRAELGQELLVLRRYAESAPQFREALRLRGRVSPVDGTAGWANNLAWMLATSTDPRVRDGAEAVQWAERACEADRHNNPLTLDTYGAALAAVGRYDEAVRASRRILALVPAHLRTVAAVEARIRLYQSGQPLREP